MIDLHGGLASRRELLESGVDPDMIDVSAWYGRRVVRVRKGWYARAGEHPDVIRAWRVGGRLTCVSALALHTDARPQPVLHIEVPASTARLRDPEDRRRSLPPGAPVVVHWARRPGPGDRRAVGLEHALRVATVCGTRSGSAG